MSTSSLIIRTPGKLMIAGEFAVLEPYKKLAVMAVNRFVYATIETNEKNVLSLDNFELFHLDWEFHTQDVHVQSEDERVRFVESAMSIALLYLKENNVKWQPFKLSIKSELDDESGIKYGLGSSAAVSTSVIAAILHKFLPEKPSADLVFRLAAISHAKTQGNGSGADVAASSFGGVLEYSSFQAYWLNDAYKKATSIMELVEKTWTYLSIQPIQIPKNVHICIGWTGKPASTAKLVDRVLRLQKEKPEKFTTFLIESEQAVKKIMKGMEEENISLLFAGVKQNRQALREVGKEANTELETPLLTKLCDLAEQYGGAGKLSGAGGGDCGIAFMPTEESAIKLRAAWEQAGIKPLNLTIYSKGSSVMD